MPHALIKKVLRIVCYSGLTLTSAVIFANPCNEGIGGTGHSATNDGFGGTGITAQSDGFGGTGITPQNDGFGGTGATAQNDGFGGTGIVGVITGFASVCVNGVEAHFDANTHVDIDGNPSDIQQLNLGQIVAIDARGQGEQVKATRISVLHAIVGRIDAIDSNKNKIKVMGQTIQFNESTLGKNSLKSGQIVAVSGFAIGSSVIATRADIMPDSSPSQVYGDLVGGKIGGIPVNFHTNPVSGKNLQVSGKWDGKTLAVTEVKLNALDRMMQNSYAFDVQGVSNYPTNGNSVYVLGKPVYIDKNTKIQGINKPAVSSVVVHGYVDKSGRAIARAIKYYPVEKVLDLGGSKIRPARIEVESTGSNNAKEQSGSDPAKSNENEKPIKPESPDKMKKNEKIEKHNGIDKPERVEKPEKVEKPDKVDKLERIETPERPQLPERVEKYTY